MSSLNRVFLIGNLTRDPEVRYLASGTAVADLRLAVNRKYKTQQGEDKEETCFVNITAWGRQAETCGQYLNKGSQVLVEGRLKFDEWEKDGQKQSRLSVVADRVQFMSSPRRGGQEEGDAPGFSSSSAAAGPATTSDGPPFADDADDIPF